MAVNHTKDQNLTKGSKKILTKIKHEMRLSRINFAKMEARMKRFARRANMSLNAYIYIFWEIITYQGGLTAISKKKVTLGDLDQLM